MTLNPHDEPARSAEGAITETAENGANTVPNVTIAEAATACGVSKAWVYCSIERGRIAFSDELSKDCRGRTCRTVALDDVRALAAKRRKRAIAIALAGGE